MKKNTIILGIILFTLVALFCTISCEREVEPESQIPLTEETNLLSSNNIIGTWVKCGATFVSNEEPDCIWDTSKDTIVFTEDGKFFFIRGDYYADSTSYVDSRYYENTNSFLILLENADDYTNRVFPIKFCENNTQLKIYNWSGFPPSWIDDPIKVCFRKIN